MKEKIIKEWSDYFDNAGIAIEYKKAYLTYIEKLLSIGVPIIFEFNHLALLLGRTPKDLAKMVNSPENFYREFTIKKKLGGEREITAPHKSLLEVQKWIYNNILKSIKIHSSAHGFTNKKSIITNAKLHVNQRNLLKLDLKDFFPSIEINRIISVFKNLGYPTNVSFYLASLCTYNRFLPQGAPTSPNLSNIVAYKMDSRLRKLASNFKLKYSRYADDLIFSGDMIPAKFYFYIKDIINSEGFEINERKTQLHKTKTKRIITGISVQDEKIKLPRDYKRKLKLELNFILKYGFESHVKNMKIKKYNYIDIILGKVNFWLSIEPENNYAKNAREKLLEYKKLKLSM